MVANLLCAEASAALVDLHLPRFPALTVICCSWRALLRRLADGRASCGAEYHKSTNAYTIYALQESWYLRRIQTCEVRGESRPHEMIKFRSD